MCRTVASLTSVILIFGLLATTSYGQLDGLYEFDGGGDGASWDDATNWEQVSDPNGNPISGDPATPPDAVTSANISLAGVVIDNTMPGQTALDARIGTANGAGSLSMSGGGLTVRDLSVGQDASGVNGGTFDISAGMLMAGDDIEVGAGSAGQMTMSGGDASTGDDFFIRADSSLHMMGGTIFVGDRLVMEDNASLTLDSGDILADDDFFFFGDSQITVNNGSMVVFDKLRFDDDDARNGKLTINGEVVRSNEFGFVDDGGTYILRGLVEINGDGVYQVEAPDSPTDPASQLTVADAKALVAAGRFITSEPSPFKLGVQTVVVPEFDGRQNVLFTQISVIPEPASYVLLTLGVLGLAIRMRKA